MYASLRSLCHFQIPPLFSLIILMAFTKVEKRTGKSDLSIPSFTEFPSGLLRSSMTLNPIDFSIVKLPLLLMLSKGHSFLGQWFPKMWDLARLFSSRILSSIALLDSVISPLLSTICVVLPFVNLRGLLVEWI